MNPYRDCLYLHRPPSLHSFLPPFLFPQGFFSPRVPVDHLTPAAVAAAYFVDNVPEFNRHARDVRKLLLPPSPLPSFPLVAHRPSSPPSLISFPQPETGATSADATARYNVLNRVSTLGAREGGREGTMEGGHL